MEGTATRSRRWQLAGLVVAALALALVARADAGPKAAPKPRTVKTAPKAGKPAKPAQPAATAKAGKAPQPSSKRPVAKAVVEKPAAARARVAVGLAGALRPVREAVGRREEPLTPEEAIAKQIEALLRGPLRNGLTGLYVADARTGEAVFAVNADDALNVASNVKMISTATALELLGPSFRYATRLLGPEPDARGVVRGDVFLLGTWDPTLSAADLKNIARQVAARGVKQLHGNVLVGSDPTRDGIYRAMIPIEVKAGEPGKPPVVSAPEGMDLVTLEVKATTARAAMRKHKLKLSVETVRDDQGRVRDKLMVSGTIGKGKDAVLRHYTKERTAFAAHALRAALRGEGIQVTGDVGVGQLGDFIGDAVGATGLPHELGRHESAPLADIVRRINKWSVNWLADRVIMTARSRRCTPGSSATPRRPRIESCSIPARACRTGRGSRRRRWSASCATPAATPRTPTPSSRACGATRSRSPARTARFARGSARPTCAATSTARPGRCRR
jgi:D-alanyl-D-alanine carboxypeptidase